MFLFKYYRPDLFFEKAIRYNELYFSSTDQLNDPNDLKTSYFFEDNASLWQKLLESEVFLGVRELKHILDLDDQRLAKELCRIFLGTPVDGSIEQLQDVFNKYDSEITSALIKCVKNTSVIDRALFESVGNSLPGLISLCKNGIKDRVLKGLRVGVYSVSFSSNALEPMMWAHYTAGFKGCVVIYHAPNNIIRLKRNVYSNEYINYPIDNVQYQNQEKHIPILKSVLSDDLAIRETLLVKNTFWSYEAEKRIFLTRRYISQSFPQLYTSFSDDVSERIFHHDSSTIAGVVFGPRFNKRKMEAIEFLLRDNRRHFECEPFYLFDTELTSKGTIKIVRGKRVESSFYSGDTGEVSTDELQALLKKFEITET